MKATFVAKTGEESQLVFGDTFYKDSLPKTQPELDERIQVAAFLRTFALSAACQFPIVVNILPREQRPDFKVTFGSTEIGIETSKIANWELEEIRSVQRSKKLGTIQISSLLRPQAKRSLDNKIRDCTGVPVFIIPEPDQTQREGTYWLEQAMAIILRKHGITKQPTYSRCEESWLLLWDRLSYDNELEQRVKSLADWVRPYWGSEFFEKIIIQQQHSEQFFILSRQCVDILERRAFMPATKFCLPEDIASSIEGREKV